MNYWKDSHKAVEKPLSQKLYLQWGVWKLVYNFHISVDLQICKLELLARVSSHQHKYQCQEIN